MDALRQWAFGICSAAIACGLIQLVLPKSGMQKIFSVTASVFFLSCLLSPLAAEFPEIEDFSVEQQEIQREVERRSQNLREEVERSGGEMAIESARHIAAQTLEEIGVPYRKIYVNVHDDEQDSISIIECEVQLDQKYMPRHDEIRGVLMQRLGINVLIGYESNK